MNLLDTASLVVTPNGYKASKLYSIVPSDGTGDMTFARTGDTATRVNPSGLIAPINANIPRLDYLGSTCPKLLLEPQRTNLILRSEEFDNASWTKDSGGVGSIPVVTANNAISPDGTQDADLIVFNLNGGTASGDFSYVAQIATVTISTVYTFSIYAKTSDNSTKTISLVDGNGTNTLLTITGSWQRFSRTYTTALTTANMRLRLRGSASGEGTSTSASINLWGAQLEAGAYATSYIPTTTASVTRNVDSITRTSSSALIGQTEGVVFFDLNLDSRLSFSYLLVRNTAVTNYIGFTIDNTKIRAEISNAGFNQARIDYASSSTGRFKIAVAYKANDIAFYLNGSLIGTDTVATIPTCDILDFYFNAVNGIRINSAALWKTRLTNQELATLTTI